MKKYVFPGLYSLGVILIGALFSSLLYYLNVTGDKLNSSILYATSIIAIFVGALKLAKNLKYKGLITGVIYFSIWFIIMLFFSLVIFKASFSIKNIIYYLVLLIFSILGSILGKNMQEETDAI